MSLRKPRKDVNSPQTARANAEYETRVRNFRTVHTAMKFVSLKAAGRQVEWKLAWAAALFTRLCTLCQSISKLLAEPMMMADESDYWDYSSIASLTRVVLDCYMIFYYLCIDADTEEKFRDRMNLLHLHDCSARVSMFRKLFVDAEEAKRFEEVRKELLDRFKDSSYVADLPEKQRRHLLRGDKAMFEIQDDVLTRMGVDIPRFRAWYEVLSAHVHSYPLAFHRMVMDGRGDGVENNIEKNWTSMTLEYLCEFLARAVTEMISLFPDIPDPRLNPRVLKDPSVTSRRA